MELVSGLKDAIEAFVPFKKIGSIALTKIRNRVTTPYRVEKLSDDFFNSRINIGSVVTVKGVLSRYAPTYRPLSYVPTIPRKGEGKITGLSREPGSNRIIQHKTLTTSFQTFQFPVQALPPMQNELGRYCIAYLYPESFNGFLLEQDPNKKDNLADSLLINDSSRMIPILIPEHVLENNSECRVTLTGVVSLIPEDITRLLSNGSCETRSSFYYAFHRPTSVKISFCIDCRTETSFDIRQNARLETLPAAIYIEGHFEGVADERYRNEFKLAVPDVLDFDFGFATHPGKILYVTANKHISAIGALPSIFGFYAETDLADNRDLDVKLSAMQQFYKKFRQSAGREIRQQSGTEAKFKPDFIYDWRRQNYFHPEGVLSNKDVDIVLKAHAELTEITSWLNQKK